MPHRHHDAAGGDEAPSPRPSAVCCYAFLTRSHRAGAYRRLDSAPALEAEAAAAEVRVEVGTTAKGRAKKSVFHVDPAVLEAGPVRRLLAAVGRRAPGGGVAVDVDALLFEHLLWLATKARDGVGGDDDDSVAAADDLSDIVEFYSQDDDEEEDRDHGLISL
ncbi:hypothetical protein BDA96_02G403200 [Sorghum bicolor]|uniref:Uncharacterized protein n=2 Tax=Sorghum bicolor TaxID=4558 RepID=A0A921RSQ3_SORBI|nr:hypothetical protein SORBI_3002G384000 [Sorghum bicolor]KAG0545924.1 hypothetical protein BDA96_02G403200 [Sorghum bicolor]